MIPTVDHRRIRRIYGSEQSSNNNMSVICLIIITIFILFIIKRYKDVQTRKSKNIIDD